jgi:XTP/dITP diphosphohydrolase
MQQLIFATNNEHKLQEVASMLSDNFKLISLSEAGFLGEIPENKPTIEGNALEKAWYIFNACHKNCFADDTGLEVEALNGEPGVYSARYAGVECHATNNITKLLNRLNGNTNRKARFKTVIALILLNEKPVLFEGIINGTITTEIKGRGGFGYDSVFIPDGYTETFAEMNASEKNKISHRALAIKQLVAFLKT